MNFSVIPSNLLSSKATKIDIKKYCYSDKAICLNALRHIMPIFVVLLDKLVGITLKFIH